ncbi:MAG: ABC transporter ATP-binding protein [Pseudomonadota bacterium]
MAEPVLAIRGLEKRFGALKATDAVTLDLRREEIHALIGPNGAGKSTLIKQITGELAPDAGEIRFQGRDITRLDAPARARAGLARSFQISAVAPEFSVLQNVVLCVQGAQGLSWRFLRRALRTQALVGPAQIHIARVGLEGRETVRAADLSHGERRRLEMALALAMKPRAFLLDEPMAGMGPDGAREMTALLARLKAEAPILLVEHDMDAVFALADRISVLVYGRIIASGSVAEIRANREVQEAYLGEAA